MVESRMILSRGPLKTPRRVFTNKKTLYILMTVETTKKNEPLFNFLI